MKIKSGLAVAVLFWFFAALPALAGDLEKPSKAEVIEEVSRFTGLTGDVVGLVHEEKAALFENVNHAVFAAKAVNMIADARDQELATEIAMQGVEYGLDKIKEKFLPVAMNGFLAAAGVYKTSLEIIRDYIVIPRFDDAIYQAYKASRSGDSKMDASPEARETAFAAGVMNSASGYYMVKGRMFDDMIKARGLNKDVMGEPMVKKLERRIDDFWINRLETRYQLELLKTQKDNLKAETWKRVAKDLDAIRAEAARPRAAQGPDGFFFSDGNLPKGFKRLVDPSRPDDFKIGGDAGAKLKFQHFFMLNSDYLDGLVENRAPKQAPSYKLSDGDARANPSQIEVSVSLRPRPEWADTIRQQLKNKTLTVDLSGDGITAGGCKSAMESRYYFHCNFVKGGWYAELITWSLPARQLQDWQAQEVKRHDGKPGKYVDQTTTSMELTQQMAKTVASKIPAGK
ncbi:MAG: hypothetical protein HY579_11820 [Nitrospinae bacterium]|nr:hypothetical protein [Nitrospinota bacterium]